MPESYLENALAKLARQLVAFDEASLMDLWEKYAEAVRQFEPTRRWEEAALIFGMIQAVRMKNQLFNYNLAASRRAGNDDDAGPELLDLTAPGNRPAPEARREARPDSGSEEGAAGAAAQRRGPVRGSVRQGGKPKAGKLIPLRRRQD